MTDEEVERFNERLALDHAGMREESYIAQAVITYMRLFDPMVKDADVRVPRPTKPKAR